MVSGREVFEGTGSRVSLVSHLCGALDISYEVSLVDLFEGSKVASSEI